MRSKKYAIVCLPSDALNRGLKMKYLGEVNVNEAKKQHKTYCAALKHLEFKIIEMPANSNYPDSVFVEDPAVIINDLLVTTRLRRKERSGEENALRASLSPFFSRIFKIKEPGFIEGGDVLVTDDQLFIGISHRTNAEGADQLAKIARDYCGYKANIFEIPKHFLHLKGGASFHLAKDMASRNIIIVTEEMAHNFSGSGYKLLVVPAEERFGANCISGNGEVFIHSGRENARKLFEEAGFVVHELLMSEFEKIDGAMSCLSKLFVATEWFGEDYGFFGEFYLEGDNSREGYLISQKQSLIERTQTEVDGAVRLLDLRVGQNVLDIPCGYGRHSIELAKKGFRVLGSDLNSVHLERAQAYAAEKGVDVIWKQEDMIEISYFQEFDAVINMFYSFGFFETDEENEMVLRNFFRALKPGGKFLFHTDVNIPRVLSGKYKEDETRRLVSGKSLRIIDKYNPEDKRMYGSWIIKDKHGREVRRDYSIRVYTEEEFVTMCEGVGFRHFQSYGDWNRTPYTKDSEDMIIVAKKEVLC